MKRLIRFAAFIAVFCVLLSVVTSVMMQSDAESTMAVETCLQAPAGSLDAVYIGSSNCLKYWNAMLAWEQYGICVQPLATSLNPFYTTENFIRIARKTQPDALYIVNINTLNNELYADMLRAVIDSFPFSLEKLSLISHMCEYTAMSPEEKIGYFLPFMRYHTRWNELSIYDFKASDYRSYKGSCTHELYLRVDTDISDEYTVLDQTVQLYDKLTECTDRLLDYCDREQVHILFVIVPQSRNDSWNGKYNALQAFIEQRGYPVLDLRSCTREMGIDLAMDFYNDKHTNIHGSAKYTYYLSEYLINHYGFAGKRGQAAYRSWDEELIGYSQVVAPYLLDIEHIPHANTAKTSITEVTVSRNADSMAILWQAAEDADGYLVYRKDREDSAWTMIADTDAPGWTDTVVEDANPFYTVVPYMNGEIREYGSFIHAGVQAQCVDKNE